MKESQIGALVDFIKKSIIVNGLSKKILLRLIEKSEGLTKPVHCQLSEENGFSRSEQIKIFADLSPLCMHFLIRNFLLGTGTDFMLHTSSKDGFIWLTNSPELHGKPVNFTRAALDEQDL